MFRKVGGIEVREASAEGLRSQHRESEPKALRRLVLNSLLGSLCDSHISPGI